MKLLKISQAQFYRLAYAGKIPATRYFGEWRVDAQKLNEVVNVEIKREECRRQGGH